MSRTVSRVDVHGPVGRVVQRVAGSHAFAPVAKHVVPRLDRVLNRATRGRFILATLIAPSLVLTARGARSGQPRQTPLVTLPDDDGSLLVVGSNFGQPRHPAWTANLLANPDVTVTYRGRTFPARAHLLEDAERAEVWPRLTQVWPVYDRYVEMSGRELRVFRLVPA
jgi:deazaflavin-dependent oxidoreductase (nitroreductase family)